LFNFRFNIEPLNTESDDDETASTINRNVSFEGYLYKITTSTKKLKKLWFKLFYKDLYCIKLLTLDYKNPDETTHIGMHHLSGVFLKEEKPIVYDNVPLYAFSVIYPKKTRIYYVDNERDYNEWVCNIRMSTGYSSLTDIYEVKQKIGNGKFGQVRLGMHKQTHRKVAVKVMSKKEMKTLDLELVRTEIEILKICQHPNIIRLYDVFENEEYIYIIMEHCGGGDLFSYIEKRSFKVEEKRAAQLIHKLSTAIYYLHSYGITHRDLKPENILMTDHSDLADLRLVDFGLSKIIGPNETCEEPFGTLVKIY
jgi:tRNA A-37 threonylcarbamoyl transferase component Bud32